MSYVTDSFDDEIVKILQKGGVGVLPTDTIYGLSGRALDPNAVEKIHRLKKRDSNKPLVVLISNLDMLDLLSVSKEQADVVKNYWPGQLSLEFQAPRAPIWLHRGLEHFAIRMPAYAKLSDLINKVGPIVSTSANLQGQTPLKSVQEAISVFGESLDFYVDAGELNSSASTLVELKNGKLAIVRQGAVKIV